MNFLPLLLVRESEDCDTKFPIESSVLAIELVLWDKASIVECVNASNLEVEALDFESASNSDLERLEAWELATDDLGLLLDFFAELDFLALAIFVLSTSGVTLKDLVEVAGFLFLLVGSCEWLSVISLTMIIGV